GQRSRLYRRRIRLRPRPRREGRLHAGFVVEDLAAPPDHHTPQLRVVVAGLDHQRHSGIAPDVDDLLRLAVRGHVERALPREVVHGDDVGEAVLVDGGQGGFLMLPKERGLLVGAQPDLLPSIGCHSCPSPLTWAGVPPGSVWPRRSSASPQPQHTRGACARRSRGGPPPRTLTGRTYPEPAYPPPTRPSPPRAPAPPPVPRG